jgi:hypothetical protein
VKYGEDGLGVAATWDPPRGHRGRSRAGPFSLFGFGRYFVRVRLLPVILDDRAAAEGGWSVR